ncbi:hypothetical protein ACH5RR_041038 [Cinchona calisaya]|uniref:NADH dehydrogenase subunit 1 n=1 Tax=Cinchona calisaya TaxID=153742 RepID=A0ABD2XSU7_9GENT
MYIAVPAEILGIILPLLLGVTFLVLAERKVMAFVQRRKGPDNGSSGYIYVKFGSWAVVPFDYGMVLSDSNIGLLYLFAISSLGVYGIIIAGVERYTLHRYGLTGLGLINPFFHSSVGPWSVTFLGRDR